MWLRRYAVAAAFATLGLLTLGGLVSTTESGLACPDWPLCEGEYIPPMINGKEFEHTHRLAASFVGVMAFGLAALLIKHRRKDKPLLWLGVGAAVLVVVQALLGATTVWLRLPAWVSSSHQATGFAFFALVTSLAFLIAQREPGRLERPVAMPAVFGPRVLVGLGLVYLQVVAGGVMRHTRGGLACGYDLLTCNGSVWPIAGTHLAIHAHMVHRLLGVVSGLYVLWLAVSVYRAAGPTRYARPLALAAGLIVPVQVTLGILSILTSRDVLMMTLHSTLGAAFFMVLIALYWVARPSRAPASRTAAAVETAPVSPGAVGEPA